MWCGRGGGGMGESLEDIGVHVEREGDLLDALFCLFY